MGLRVEVGLDRICASLGRRNHRVAYHPVRGKESRVRVFIGRAMGAGEGAERRHRKSEIERKK